MPATAAHAGRADAQGWHPLRPRVIDLPAADLGPTFRLRRSPEAASGRSPAGRAHDRYAIHNPNIWPGAEVARPPLKSYARLTDILCPETIDKLGRFVDCENIRPAGDHGARSLSPTRVVAPSAAMYAVAPHISAPRVSLLPKVIDVTPEQAKVLQLMQLAVSAARTVMPHAGNQLGGLENSQYLSKACLGIMRHPPEHRLQNLYNAMDRRTASGANLTRDTHMTESVQGASYAAGNCLELNTFCYYLLGSLPELKPYRMELLGHEGIDHLLVAAFVGDKILVCDAWPQFPIATVSTELIPAYRDAFFPAHDDWRFEIEAAKLAHTQFEEFPADDIVATASEGLGLASVRAMVKDRYGSAAAYRAKINAELARSTTVRSMLYSSSPAVDYHCNGERFNLRYRYAPAADLTRAQAEAHARGELAPRPFEATLC